MLEHDARQICHQSNGAMNFTFEDNSENNSVVEVDALDVNKCEM